MTRLRITNAHARDGSCGTAAALVALPDDPATAYLLSASHVMAPLGAQPGDAIVALEDCPPIRAGQTVARLTTWTGLVDGTGYPNVADAAIARLEPGLVPQRDLPGLTGLRFAAGRPAAGEWLRLPWDTAGGGAVRDPARDCVVAWFDPNAPDPSQPREVDYGMAGLIVCDAMDADGDSGAAVIADRTGEVVGIVIGQPFPELGDQGDFSAISRIEAIAYHPQWGGRVLQPWSTVPPSRPAPGPTQAPAGGVGSNDALTVLAKTLLGEAGNQGDAGMRAVAWVVLNRVAARRPRWGMRPKEVCLAYKQFSCWNPGTSSRARLDAMSPADPRLHSAALIADQALAGALPGPDPTGGATFYYAPAAVTKTPAWAVGHKPCRVIGGHVFFNDVS